MKKYLIALLFVACSCGTTVEPLPPIFVAERAEHFTMIASAARADEAAVRAATTILRGASGNLAVSVLRGANGELTLASEWLTEAHARDAAKLLKTAEPQYFEVLFESSQFPADR
jgi:hypothetical protein